MVTLRPTRGWVPVDVAEIIRFKDLLYEFAGRDIRLRYKQTLLGIAWVVLQPLLAAGLLYFAFGLVAGMRREQPLYFLFTFAGLLAWNIFSWTLSKTSMSMVGNAYLVSKVYFPRLILPLSGTLSTLLDFAVSLAVMLVLLPVYGVHPGLAICLLPVFVALVFLLALGAGLIAASLTVQYRDVQYILPILIPFLLYASPVAYDVSRLAADYQRWFFLVNPLAALMMGFRWALMNGPAPPLWAMAWSTVVAVALFMLGAAVFSRTERRFGDVL
jgi:lipopolysaccharide transport system permease protein